MTDSSASDATDRLVEELAARLRRVDLVGWARIAAWAEKLELSFEDLRLILALTMTDRPASAGELAELSGLSLNATYPAVHSLRGRGYVREDRRRYSFSDEGRRLAATLDSAHREGIRTYVDELDSAERARLEDALEIGR